MKKRLVVIGVCLGALVVAALISVPHVLPRALALFRSDISFAVPNGKKEVFITIDDAPSTNTHEILRVLKKHEVTATFFVISVT